MNNRVSRLSREESRGCECSPFVVASLLRRHRGNALDYITQSDQESMGEAHRNFLFEQVWVLCGSSAGPQSSSSQLPADLFIYCRGDGSHQQSVQD